MYKLSKRQIGHWCSFCKVERATHRTKYFVKYSCSNSTCKEKAEMDQRILEERESNLTEADYETWGKLK